MRQLLLASNNREFVNMIHIHLLQCKLNKTNKWRLWYFHQSTVQSWWFKGARKCTLCVYLYIIPIDHSNIIIITCVLILINDLISAVVWALMALYLLHRPPENKTKRKKKRFGIWWPLIMWRSGSYANIRYASLVMKIIIAKSQRM